MSTTTLPYGGKYADIQGLDQSVNPEHSKDLGRLAIATLRMALIRREVTRELIDQGIEPGDVAITALSAEICRWMVLRCMADGRLYLHEITGRDPRTMIHLHIADYVAKIRSQADHQEFPTD